MAKRADSTTEPQVPLRKERILQAAIALADEGGIESLTMRRLAAELGVEAMSLYNHVANKDDVLDGIIDLVVDEIDLPSGGEAWDVAIRQCAVSAHKAFLRHPWACSLVISHTSPRMGPTPRLRYIEWLLRRLREAGFAPELAYHAYHALDSHILGFTFWELGHSAAAKALDGSQNLADFASSFFQTLPTGEFTYLAEHAQQHIDPSTVRDIDEFAFGLELILDGLNRLRDTA